MARKINRRKLKDAVAIVGEGITEWHYFTDLKQTERYSFKVKPELPKHSDVEAIVKKAKELLIDGYDKVLCLFDMDRIYTDKTENSKYLRHRNKLHKKKSKIGGQIIFYETMPCIEFWFLLHFINFSTRVYPDYNSLKSKLLNYLKGYDKSNEYFKKNKIYQILTTRGSIKLAIDSAEKLVIEKNKSENVLLSFSEMHDLLTELKK